ncbi:patatin-like phospholipase family protein, partial [candidate division CSSED10-310 bacterium]
IEFIKALDEMGLKPAIISGTSIGAIIGAFYAAGISGLEMENYVKEIKFKDLYKMIDLSLIKNSAVLKGDGVEEFLTSKIPIHDFEALPIPLKIVATDFWKRDEVIIESGQIIPAVRASISLPAMFKPVELQGRVLIDGGAVNPLPYDIIRDQCDILIAIDVSGEKIPDEDNSVPKMFECILSTFQIMQTSIVESKMALSKPDIYIKPVLRNIRVLDFHRYKEIMEGVQEDVLVFKKKLRALLTSDEPLNSPQP